MSQIAPPLSQVSAVQNDHITRLLPATNRKEIFELLEDFHTYIPPKNASGKNPSTIPRNLSTSFTLRWSPMLARSACDALVEHEREAMAEGFAEGEDKLPALGSAAAYTYSSSILSWDNETEFLATYDVFGISAFSFLLGAFRFLPQIIHYRCFYKKGIHESFALPESSCLITHGNHAFDRKHLEELESPHYIRLLYLTNLDVVEEIRDLAMYGLFVDSHKGRAAWPSLHDDTQLSDKMKRAQEILVWVFECAYQANVEFVKLTDRWTTIFFQVDYTTSVLHVGPAMLPRYPLTSLAHANPSVAYATSAFTWLARFRKVYNADGKKMYLPGWRDPGPRYNLRSKADEVSGGETERRTG